MCFAWFFFCFCFFLVVCVFRSDEYQALVTGTRCLIQKFCAELRFRTYCMTDLLTESLWCFSSWCLLHCLIKNHFVSMNFVFIFVYTAVFVVARFHLPLSPPCVQCALAKAKLSWDTHMHQYNSVHFALDPAHVLNVMMVRFCLFFVWFVKAKGFAIKNVQYLQKIISTCIS